MVLFSVSLSAYGGERQSKPGTNTMVADNGSTVAPQNSRGKSQSNLAPLRPYPRLLPLQLASPLTAQAGIPLAGVNVSLNNPGEAAPNARLRLIIHEKDAGHLQLNPDNIKVEVLENGAWVPVQLSLVEGNVMGAIGAEGVIAHQEHYKRGGFAIPAGFNKTWQLRVTFSLPGIYSLVAAVSPDNGSRHLAQPAHSIIEVQ